MVRLNRKLKSHKTGLKLLLSAILSYVLVLNWQYKAYSQVTIEQQVMEAAADLEPDARTEFFELIRDPEVLGDAVKELGINPDVVERVRESVPEQPKVEDKIEHTERSKIAEMNIEEKISRKIDKVSTRLDRIDARMEKKLSNIKDFQVRTIEAAEIDKIELRTIEAVSIESKEALIVEAEVVESVEPVVVMSSSLESLSVSSSEESSSSEEPKIVEEEEEIVPIILKR